VTGGPEGPARVGVSIVDVAAGLNAYEAILEALIARGRTNEGTEISVSMFDAMAEWMTVPLLHGEGGVPFKRIGLAHAAIAPYGVFKSRDGADILIAIQNDREWRVLAEKVLGDAALGSNPRFATNPKRVENRAETDAKVAADFARHDVESLMKMLEAADIAFARVNDWELLSKHAHLRRITVGAPSGPVTMPAPAPLRTGQARTYGPIPALGEHTEIVRKEFLP
jgi:formyl-CoA transferase